MGMLFPFTADMLNTITRNIRDLATAYQVSAIPKDKIGYAPGGRKSIDSFSWPIDQALAHLELQGAIRIIGPNVEIIKPEYFNIRYDSFSVPVRFSPDEKIKADLAVMTGLYALIYDVENRVRFYLTNELKQRFGESYIDHLPKAVRDKIGNERSKRKLYVVDTRVKELDYTDFSDLKRIANNLDIPSHADTRQSLLDKLDYLNEARTLVAHNHAIAPDEVQKITDYCTAVRNIIKA